MEGAGGQWYAVYHGTRPRGGFPEFNLLGRETFIARVEWEDAWPVFVEWEKAALPKDDPFVETFRDALAPCWVSPSGDLEGVTTGQGGLRLEHSISTRPLLRRVTHLSWEAIALLDVSHGAGRLLLYLDDSHWYALEASAEGVEAVANIGPLRQRLGRDQRPGSRVEIRISAVVPSVLGSIPTGQPDDIALAVKGPDGWNQLAMIDGRYLSNEVAGGFTGRMLGIEATSGELVCPRFIFRTTAPESK